MMLMYVELIVLQRVATCISTPLPRLQCNETAAAIEISLSTTAAVVVAAAAVKPPTRKLRFYNFILINVSLSLILFSKALRSIATTAFRLNNNNNSSSNSKTVLVFEKQLDLLKEKKARA